MNGLICDNCAAVLAFDAVNGCEDSNGEKAAWIEIHAGGRAVDACSRSCAVELLRDGGTLAEVVDAHLAAIADIARRICESRSDDDDDD